MTNCGSGGDVAAELQGKLREAAVGVWERHGCPAHHSHYSAASVVSLVVWLRLPWQARANIKRMDFHYPFPSATFMCLTHLSLGVLCDTSVKMFFLINNP